MLTTVSWLAVLAVFNQPDDDKGAHEVCSRELQTYSSHVSIPCRRTLSHLKVADTLRGIRQCLRGSGVPRPPGIVSDVVLRNGDQVVT